MVDYVIDTNILIYLDKREQKYVSFLRSVSESVVGISAITYMEFVMGATNQPDAHTHNILDALIVLPIHQEIAHTSAEIMLQLHKKRIRDPLLADIIIGCTARHYDVPLVTNNAKDFSVIEDLKIVAP